MTRTMIDVTHDGLPGALAAIHGLHENDIVALYDTGSPDIAASPSDIAAIPVPFLTVVFIDQGFTGSPNSKAMIRDCEQGAWSLDRAVNKTGWTVPRPTLYLGYPDTATLAYQAGWRGDVWLVRPSSSPPASPPAVPQGMNVVAVQWNYPGAYDGSVVFDPTWPGESMAQPTDPSLPVIDIQDNWAWCHKCQGMFYKPGQSKSVCPAGAQHDGGGSFNYAITNLP